MPAERSARVRSAVLRSLIGVLAGAAAVAIVAGPASAAVVADPVFDEGGCVIYRVTDNGPQGAQCAGVNLTGTRFGEGDFRGANLIGASFAGGDVQGAVFAGANISGADFSGTRIVGADFTGAGIVPATVDVTADASGSAPVAFDVTPPPGLTVDGCSIVGAPVDSGQVFPIGTSNVLCTISSSFKGTATAVMTVNVVASATATPTATPLFTPEPVTATPVPIADSPSGSETPNWLMIGGFVGGGLLVLVGIVAFVVTNRRPKPDAGA
ncbi:pentapeptide repeat-containing protein [Herbiconiux sp. 11R-BC]|uniref:pentapeptide repeat-containing protein n=1 Tax=Herbiconiux sp. 11R-BC TaxID=3111637 RepID=UPI003C0D8C24